MEMVGMGVEMKGREAEREGAKGREGDKSEQVREMKGERECRHRDKKVFSLSLSLRHVLHHRTGLKFSPALVDHLTTCFSLTVERNCNFFPPKIFIG